MVCCFCWEENFIGRAGGSISVYRMILTDFYVTTHTYSHNVSIYWAGCHVTTRATLLLFHCA